MAISNLTLPAFPPFSLDEYSTISTRWRKYEKRFENLVLTLNVQDGAQKKALLLNYLGDEKHRTFTKIYLQEGQTKHMMQLLHSWTDIFRQKIILHMNVMYFKIFDKMWIRTFISFTYV